MNYSLVVPIYYDGYLAPALCDEVKRVMTQFLQSPSLQDHFELIFVNDGPGLLLGSMWDDYAKLEESWQNDIMVLTLRMMLERLTLDWLTSKI